MKEYKLIRTEIFDSYYPEKIDNALYEAESLLNKYAKEGYYISKMYYIDSCAHDKIIAILLERDI